MPKNLMSAKWTALYRLIDFIVLLCFAGLVFLLILPVGLYVSFNGSDFISLKLIILLPLTVISYLGYAFIATPILLKIGIWDGLTKTLEADGEYGELCTRAQAVQEGDTETKRQLIAKIYKPVWDYITRFIIFFAPIFSARMRKLKAEVAAKTKQIKASIQTKTNSIKSNMAAKKQARAEQVKFKTADTAADTKPVDAPAVTKPVDTKPVDAPADTKPVDTAADAAADTKPVDTTVAPAADTAADKPTKAKAEKTTEPKPAKPTADDKPQLTKPQLTKSKVTKSKVTKDAESKPTKDGGQSI